MKFEKYYQGCAGSIHPDKIKEFDFVPQRYIAEEKYDGIWCAVVFDGSGEVSLMSRTLKEKDNEQLRSLREYLKTALNLKNSVLVGELAFSSQKGTEYAKKYGHHKIDLFDISVLDGKELYDKRLLKRKEILYTLVSKLDAKWVDTAWFKIVVSAAKVRELYVAVVEAGGEGLIIKDLDDTDYRRGGKSPYWYKIKKVVDMDYVIMGFTESNSVDYRTKGFVGGIIGGLYVNGELVQKCVIGSMTDYWRAEFYKHPSIYVHKVMTCNGFEVFRSGALRHSSFAGLHDEKSVLECTWEV